MSLQTWKEPWFISQAATAAAAAEATAGAGAGTCPPPEAAHFLCGEATLRKVKASVGKSHPGVGWVGW